MSTTTETLQTRATLDDLMRTEGKAELIGGRIVSLMGTGYKPNLVAAEIFISLHEYSKQIARGVAFTDNIIFGVPELSSGRESFSPDASYYDGPLPENEMDVVPGPPTLAVEVRSKSDYGRAAEAEMAAKRSDYFEAGTKVVWDVDIEARVVRVFRTSDPTRPDIFEVGQEADAEPALPGWRLAVERIFG